MKNFHILTEMDNGTLFFDTADTRAEADSIMEKYLTSGEPDSVCIYERESDSDGYGLVRKVKHQPKEERRLVGFGRW